MDFSLSTSKDMVVRLASGLKLTANGTNSDGVVILSRVMMVGSNECQAGTGSTNCANKNQAVFTQRHVIGDTGLRSSNFGTPSPSIILTTAIPSQGLRPGDIKPQDYTTNSSAIATGFSTLLSGMQPGELAYVAEAYFRTPDWNLNQQYTSAGVYARSIF
jgi:hypothetical protein